MIILLLSWVFDIVGKVIAGSKSDQHCRTVEDSIRGTEHSFIVKKSPEEVDHIIILVALSVVLCRCVFTLQSKGSQWRTRPNPIQEIPPTQSKGLVRSASRGCPTRSWKSSRAQLGRAGEHFAGTEWTLPTDSSLDQVCPDDQGSRGNPCQRPSLKWRCLCESELHGTPVSCKSSRRSQSNSVRLFLLTNTCLTLDLEATYSKLEISKFWRSTGLVEAAMFNLVSSSNT